MKPTRTWILICDGARARIVLNEGPGRSVSPVEGSDFLTEHPRSQDITTDRPGRVFDRSGPGRHAMENRSDPHRDSKKSFALRLAEFLDEQLRKKAYDRLIIFAAPAMLGDLRQALTETVLAKTAHQIPKDLTQIPNNELDSHLEDVLAI